MQKISYFFFDLEGQVATWTDKYDIATFSVLKYF